MKEATREATCALFIEAHIFVLTENWEISGATLNITFCAKCEWNCAVINEGLWCCWCKKVECLWAAPRHKRHACYEPNWRQCRFVSLIHRTLFSSVSLNNAKQRTISDISKCTYWQVYASLFVGRGLKFGLILGSCIMTMAQVWRARCPDVLSQKWTTKFCHPPYSPCWVLCAFWLFSKPKTASKGHRFFRHRRRSEIWATILQSVPEGRLQKYSERSKHRHTKHISEWDIPLWLLRIEVRTAANKLPQFLTCCKVAWFRLIVCFDNTVTSDPKRIRGLR